LAGGREGLKSRPAASTPDMTNDSGVQVPRKGVFSASDRWPMFPNMTEHTQASDHAAIWADLDLQ
jgi:hypothetical protein